MKVIKRLIDDYHLTLFLGVMFIVAGLMAAASDVVEVHTGFKFDLFHNMIFLGVFNLFMAIVFMILGARNLEAGEVEARKAVKKEGGASADVSEALAALESRLAELEQWRKES